MFGKISKPHFDKGWDAPYYAKGTHRKVKTNYVKTDFQVKPCVLPVAAT